MNKLLVACATFVVLLAASAPFASLAFAEEGAPVDCSTIADPAEQEKCQAEQAGGE